MPPRAAFTKIAIVCMASLAVAGPIFLVFPTVFQRAIASSREPIIIQWKRPVGEPTCLAMSSGGKYFGGIDKNGVVYFYTQSGQPIWKKRVTGATDMLIAKNGQSVLVYSRLNPLFKDVYFFCSDGRLLWTHHVDGSVWAGAVSADGTKAAVTTGKRYIYIYKPDPHRPKFRRWRLDGIGHSVAFTPNSERVLIGTWQKSELDCFSVDGDFIWRNRHSTENQYHLQTSADGKTILGLLPGARRDPKIDLRLWKSDGKTIWSRTLNGFDGCALVSPQSQYVAASYATFVSKGSRIIERKIVVFKSDGRVWWEKGGLFFGPRLVALSPSGSSVIVQASDEENSLYNIDRQGRILSKLRLGGAVRRIISSEDGHQLLVYCSDGLLYAMRVG